MLEKENIEISVRASRMLEQIARSQSVYMHKRDKKWVGYEKHSLIQNEYQELLKLVDKRSLTQRLSDYLKRMLK
ncbi:MAG: hypothetical protein U9R50_11790 [Campylobacterota bacterium]|nr:hypothetical protein [Campylobacterota bacterium]